MLPLLDTHQHLWDLSRFRLPWLPSEGPLARNFLMEDYLEAVSGLNVVKSVYMEVGMGASMQNQEAGYIIGLCEEPGNPMSAAVIGGDPTSPGFIGYVDRHRASSYVRGVRHGLPASPAGDPPCLREEYLRGIRHLGQCGWSFDLLVSTESLPVAARLAEACPDTRFVLDHCGNPDVQAPDLSDWKRGIDGVARLGNVICKISGIVASAKLGEWGAEDLAPIVLYCADAFGKDRIVFGSDWPVCTRTASLAQWVTALQEIVGSWSEADRRKLFYDNAARFYGL